MYLSNLDIIVRYNLQDSEKIGHFMHMQLRMVEIRNEVEMLENPMFRKAYEDLHFKEKSKNNNDKCNQNINTLIVTKKDNMKKMMEYFEAIEKLIGGDTAVDYFPSLKVCKVHPNIFYSIFCIFPKVFLLITAQCVVQTEIQIVLIAVRR